jgi:serine phosphatase RsbU (regulator of sigma subunit)
MDNTKDYQKEWEIEEHHLATKSVSKIWIIAALIIPFFSLFELPYGFEQFKHLLLPLLSISGFIFVVILIQKKYPLPSLIQIYGVSLILGFFFSYVATQTHIDNAHNYLMGVTSITLIRGMLYFGRVINLVAVTLINHFMAFIMLVLFRKESIIDIPNIESTLYFGVIFMIFSFVGMHIRYKLTRENFISSIKLKESFALIEEKNQNITDSITYAKRLQQAILPTLQALREFLPESFIYYKPKDIVAGDFYWMEHLKDITFIAAADSTGHGVPGAMVSIVCSNSLNRAVKEFGLTETGKILDKTRDLVLETFAKSNSDVKDGMDISLLAINKKQQQVSWSGAFNQLIYFSNGELKEILADKQPIGKTDNPKPFTTHNFELKAGDTFYLMTDGYSDQFGGEKGKKFKLKQFKEKILANSEKNLEQQKLILEKTFDDWKGALEQVDDVCIIGLKV